LTISASEIAEVEPNAEMSRREVLERLYGVLAAAVWARWSEVTARGSGAPIYGAQAGASPGSTHSLVPSITHQPVGGPVCRPAGAPKTHFFTAEEKELVATVADLIIPTDEVSPGARGAGVHQWIDFVIANSPANVQQQWREGLATLDRLSLESSGRKFQQLAQENQLKLLQQLAISEFAPTTPGERFFALAKEATVNGYYSSEIGLRKDLRYAGGTFVQAPESHCPAGGKQKTVDGRQ
jgi:hypothetical protein